MRNLSHGGAWAIAFLALFTASCSRSKDQTPPFLPAVGNGPQSFPNDPVLQRLSDAGARINPMAYSLDTPHKTFTTVHFEVAHLTRGMFANAGRIRGRLWLELKSCRIAAGAFEGVPAAEGPVDIFFENCELEEHALDALDGCNTLRGMRFSAMPLMRDDLAALSNLPGLKYFAVDGVQLNPVALEFVDACPQIQSLEVRDVPLDDFEFAALVRKRDWSAIELAGTRITDDGLRVLSRLSRLATLRLDDADIRGAGLAQLPHPEKLKTLWLSGTLLDDAGVAALARFSKLETLVIDRTRITDGGMKHLAKLRQLRRLDISRTAITDRGVKQLKGLESLNFVNLSGTRISKKAAARALGGNVTVLKQFEPKRREPEA